MMKKLLFLISICFILPVYIFCAESGNTGIKRHNVSVDFSSGFSLTVLRDYGGFAGLNAGYLYAFNKYLAFGPGVSGLFSIASVNYYDNDLNPQTKVSFIFSGGLVLAKFMIGDFEKSNIAFLLDIGVGWIAGINAGILIKNFIIKIGYQTTYSGIAHHINLSFGFMLNYGEKP